MADGHQPSPLQTKALPKTEPRPSEEVLRMIEEYADDLRAIIRKLRRLN
ncbi:hypothetical protein [Bradyrhizobium sp. NBAIM14]|nr:hypothetical protein [Bradyrhizobium sp. NBAIM14]MCA1498094.1 hypothetical protein [Bradyrhizobium sp. NBAIM14]